MIAVGISPVSTVYIDVLTVLYDVAIAVITGYIVWFKTDKYMLHCEERNAYKREQQDYSRYLGRLCIRLRSFRGSDDQLKAFLLESIEDAPVRSTFRPYREDERPAFLEVGTVLEGVRSLLDDAEIDPNDLKVYADRLARARIAIVSMRLQQPKTRWLHLFGKPALASTQ